MLNFTTQHKLSVLQGLVVAHYELRELFERLIDSLHPR